MKPQILAAIIAAIALVIVSVLKIVADVIGDDFLSSKHRKSLKRDIRTAFGSFRVALLPAADQGMADPNKWKPLVGRIASLYDPKTNASLTDRELFVLDGFVREATVALANLEAATRRVTMRLDTEPEPMRTEMTRAFEAIEGVPYDPRMSGFRKEVKTLARPLYDHLTYACVAFGHYSGLLSDEISKYYLSGSWKLRHILYNKYESLRSPGSKKWWQTWKIT